jgi:hypothetical protein
VYHIIPCSCRGSYAGKEYETHDQDRKLSLGSLWINNVDLGINLYENITPTMSRQEMGTVIIVHVVHVKVANEPLIFPYTTQLWQHWEGGGSVNISSRTFLTDEED